MKSARPFAILRRDQAGAEETFQLVPALTVVLVCVAAVMAAAGSAARAGAQSAAQERAALQAEVLLDSIRESRVLRDGGDAISWERATEVANRTLNLSFHPSSTRAISLVWFPNGTELFLVGNVSVVGEGVLIRGHPVPIRLLTGETWPGLLRVGVEVQ
jgi:hypothetical protein